MSETSDTSRETCTHAIELPDRSHRQCQLRALPGHVFCWQHEPTRTRPTFAAGDRVRLTGHFLRSTGQYTGQDAHSTWTVLSVERWPSGTLIVEVDEPSADEPTRNRRINHENLYRVRTLDHRNT